MVEWDRRKEIYQKFRKHQGVLYYKVFPIKEEASLDQIKELINPLITSQQLEVKSQKVDMDEGERTFEIVFNKP